MPRVIMFIALDVGVGLTSVLLSMIQAMHERVKLGVFKPIAQCFADNRSDNDPIVNIMHHYYSHVSFLQSENIEYIRLLLESHQQNILLESMVSRFYNFFKHEDIVFVEGVVSVYKYPIIAEFNYSIADILNAEIVFVISAHHKTYHDINKYIKWMDLHIGKDIFKNVLGIIVNKVHSPQDEYQFIIPNIFHDFRKFHFQKRIDSDVSFLSKNVSLPILGCIPWSVDLISTRVVDIVNYLNINIVLGKFLYINRIREIVFCFDIFYKILEYCHSNSLLVISLNRVDILVVVYFIIVNKMKFGAILFTDYSRDKYIFVNQLYMCFIHEVKFAFLFSHCTLEEVFLVLRGFNMHISWDDQFRVNRIQNYIIDYLDSTWLQSLRNNISCTSVLSVSPAVFCYKLIQLARKYQKLIVFPEGHDPRIIEAVSICSKKRIADCILLGDIKNIQEISYMHGINLYSKVKIMDPVFLREKYLGRLLMLRKHKGITKSIARKQLENNIVLSTLMLEMGEVDGLVAGVANTTADTLRPALQIIKTVAGVSLVSSIFLMLFLDRVLIFGDCAINPNPTAEQLAEIAVQSSVSAMLFGIEPIVAMVSYATGSSGFGCDVEKVRKATCLAKKMCPSLLIDGPLQYDTAVSPDVALLKYPNSPVAGKATVLIFPDLNTGNAVYKAVQRSANLISIGPILQGIRKPVNDLSRGASVDDIIYTVAVTNIQSQ
ncbi:MAG: phosphate acetyltransferase [Candidatus Westeberhardia cardiocondylae]|nr:phosphate acetyltransferase [Candidatus Westeberhardia cardiocondylae]